MIEDFTEAIEINPKYANAYNNRGAAKISLSDFKGAIEDFTKAIEINPKFVNAYFSRGIAKNSLNDQNGACIDWTTASQLCFSPADNWIKKYCK